MKFPLFITLPACLLVAVLTFWLSTINYDIHDAPSEQELLDLQASLKEKHRPLDITQYAPKIPEPSRFEPQKPIASAPVAPQAFDSTLAPIAPALSEYQSKALEEKSYLPFVDLAQNLTKKGFHQRALLAWERILDSVAAPPDVHRKAHEAIAELNTLTSPWVVDEDEIIALKLNIKAAETNEEALKSTATAIAEMIEQLSSGIIKITVDISGVNEVTQEDIILWMSGAGDQSKTTTQLKVAPENFTSATIKRAVAKAVYNLIKSELNKDTQFRPLRTLTSTSSPTDSLRNNLTRLQWRTFGQRISSAQVE